MQRTLIIFKPDCVQRRLVGPILSRLDTHRNPKGVEHLRQTGVTRAPAGRIVRGDIVAVADQNHPRNLRSPERVVNEMLTETVVARFPGRFRG